VRRRGGLGLESQLLVLVTLGLVAFGLVMVYSATSAAATLGGGDAGYYLKRQGVYALVGVVLLIVASRSDFLRLREIAPALVVTSLVLCAAVLLVSEPINGARRWFVLGPASFQPSELAKLTLAVWVAAYLARRRPPESLRELARPLGLLVGLFCGLILLEPDLGTTI
jgi:cell division protein FtsW